MKTAFLLACILSLSTNSCRRRNLEDLDVPRNGQSNQSADGKPSQTAITTQPSPSTPGVVTLPPEVVFSDSDKMLNLITSTKLDDIKQLIESGKVQITLVDTEGQTLLILATKANRYANVEYLLAKEPRLKDIKDKKGKTALDYANELKAQMLTDGGIDTSEIDLIIKLLGGEEINPQDFLPEVITILNAAVPEIGMTRLAELMKMGVDANSVDDKELVSTTGEIVEAPALPIIFLSMGIRRSADNPNAPIKIGGRLNFPYAKLLVESGAKLDVTVKLRGRELTPAKLFEQIARQLSAVELSPEQKQEWIKLLSQN